MSNAIETIDNEMICFIIYCLNCIRHGRNATYERGLSNREFEITTTATATGTPLNKRFNEQNNGSARGL